jgi:type IV secretion system protein VirD4
MNMSHNIVYKLFAMGSLIFMALLGALVGVQSIASNEAHADWLGDPLIELFGTRIYSPFTLFDLISVLGTSNPSSRVGVSWTLGGIGSGILLGLAIRLRADKLLPVKAMNIFGDAAFAAFEEIKKMGLLGKGRGVFLGKTEQGEFIRHDGPEHYAVIAPTRSGKGTGVVVPTLLTWRGSCIVYDLKQENFERTAGVRSEFSDILYFNPNSLDTCHFNPLLEIRQGILEVRDAQNLANMIIEPDRPGVQDHWVRTGNSLLTAAILHVMYAAPRGEKNLAGVTGLLSRAEKNLTETLQEMLETKHLRDEQGRPHKPHPGVVAAARDVLNKSPDDKSSVASTVMGYLGVYRDPLLANATRDSDFSINDLVNGERPKSLYMVIPASDIDRLRPIIRIMVNLICRRLTEQAVRGSHDQEHKHKLLMMLDEFPALGRLEFFESALGFMAGYGIKAMLVAQSLSQLRQVYGDRSSLLDNTHVRVFFRPETIDTAEYISRTIGQTTIGYRTKGESGKKGSPFFSNVNESHHFSARPLLTPREIMELPDDEALVLVGGGKPIRAKKIRYFHDNAFSPLLLPPPSTARQELLGNDSPWFSDRFSPPSDFEEELIELDEGDDGLIVTGEAEELGQPAAQQESDDEIGAKETEDDELA